MAIVIIVIVCILIFALFLGVTIAGGRAHDRQNLEADLQRLANGREATKAKAERVANRDPWPRSDGEVSSRQRPQSLARVSKDVRPLTHKT